MEYNCLKGIKPAEYEYPGENNAFAALKKIPMLDRITAEYLKYRIQSGMMPELLGDCFRVTEQTCPQVYTLYLKALKRLDMPEEYPLFAKAEYQYNAYASGGSAPFVVIHSSMLKNLTEEELLFVLGHEIGHIKSGHLVYYNMAVQLNTLLRQTKFPGVQLITSGVQLALIHWARMHEFTADRAGVLATGSIEGGQRGLACLLGVDEKLPGIHFEIEDLLSQNVSFEQANQDIIGKLISAGEIMMRNHPWTISRIQALDAWKKDGSYDVLMAKYV